MITPLLRPTGGILIRTSTFFSKPFDCMENMNMFAMMTSYPTTVDTKKRDTKPASRRHSLGSIVKFTYKNITIKITNNQQVPGAGWGGMSGQKKVSTTVCVYDVPYNGYSLDAGTDVTDVTVVSFPPAQRAKKQTLGLHLTVAWRLWAIAIL